MKKIGATKILTPSLTAASVATDGVPLVIPILVGMFIPRPILDAGGVHVRRGSERLPLRLGGGLGSCGQRRLEALSAADGDDGGGGLVHQGEKAAQDAGREGF